MSLLNLNKFEHRCWIEFRSLSYGDKTTLKSYFGIQTSIFCQTLYEVNIKHYGNLDMMYSIMKFTFAIFSILINAIITLQDATSYDKQCNTTEVIVFDCLVISYKLIYVGGIEKNLK